MPHINNLLTDFRDLVRPDCTVYGGSFADLDALENNKVVTAE